MHTLYKRAGAYASDATPKLQGYSGCRQPLLYLAQMKVTVMSLAVPSQGPL